MRAGEREEVLHAMACSRVDGLESSVLRVAGAFACGHRMASARMLTPRATSATMAVTVMSVLFCTGLPSIPAGYRVARYGPGRLDGPGRQGPRSTA